MDLELELSSGHAETQSGWIQGGIILSLIDIREESQGSSVEFVGAAAGRVAAVEEPEDKPGELDSLGRVKELGYKLDLRMI